MYVVTQSVMFPSKSDSPQKESNLIQATLLFDFPLTTAKTPVAVTKEETPEPVEPEDAFVVEEKPVDSEIEPISEPEAQPSTTSFPPQALPSQALLPKLEEAQAAPEQNNQENEITIIEQNITPTPNSDMRTPATNMARRHLSSFQQQQQNRVAEQASRYYQQHKNSPIIDNEVNHPFMTADEKFRGSLKVRADCSSTSTKTTAVILGFLGGQIDCSKPPPISGFIQDRINKGSLLPEQFRQEDQKIPQSIVIKKQP
jgi:hypothetical protein